MRNISRISLVILVLTISVVTFGCGVVSKESNLESVESVKQKVISHLQSEGYKEDEYQINVEYSKSSSYGGPYSINVTFNDEKDIVYNYRYNYNSEIKDIKQISISPLDDKKGKDFKHAED